MNIKDPWGWNDLTYWDSGEWQVVQEKLEDLEKKRIIYNPERQNLFNALDACPYDKVKVAIFGQDPYPEGKYATGIAFSIPKASKTMPPTLVNLLKEYNTDTGLDVPTSGNLEKWCDRGVLLWNVVPSCTAGSSLSHNWDEWKLLTNEIIKKLSERTVVMVFLGGTARNFVKEANEQMVEILEASHPSPRASNASNNPFFGSRVFTTANLKLAEWGIDTIDWKL